MLYTPKTKRGAETREKILKSAEDCFSGKGYFHTAISDITKGADIAPGTFYIYFEDKLSVFRCLLTDLGHRLRSRIHAAVEGCETRLEIETRGMREFIGFAADHRGIFKIFWDAQFVDQEAFKAYYEGFASAYARRLGLARDSGQVRDVDLTALAYSLIGIANFVALKYTVFESGEIPESVLRTVTTLLSEGAFPEGPSGRASDGA